MRIPLNRLLSAGWWIAALTFVVQPMSASAITVSPPPAKEYVSQVWLGFSIDDRSTLRLDLQSDGTGSGVLVEYEESRSFRITSWSLNGSALALTIEFDASKHMAQRLSGKFKTYLLSYTEGMLPHPEKVYEREIPGRLELAFENSVIRFGLWPEKELLARLERARTTTRRQPTK